jgi:hypothetical protein
MDFPSEGGAIQIAPILYSERYGGIALAQPFQDWEAGKPAAPIHVQCQEFALRSKPDMLMLQEAVFPRFFVNLRMALKIIPGQS